MALAKPFEPKSPKWRRAERWKNKDKTTLLLSTSRDFMCSYFMEKTFLNRRDMLFKVAHVTGACTNMYTIRVYFVYLFGMHNSSAIFYFTRNTAGKSRFILRATEHKKKLYIPSVIYNFT